MRVICTCGPSFEPIDDARRLTNMSTGRLGIHLTNFLTRCGHAVTCLKGEGATCADPIAAERVLSFATNSDLAETLERLGRTERFDAVLHAAALCDFKVARVLANGQGATSAKYSTRDGELTLVLEPTLKVLPELRGWFPDATIVGWKYELAGNTADAFAAAWRQIRGSSSDACVLNGAAYGSGFALCLAPGQVIACQDLESLATNLERWLVTKSTRRLEMACAA